MDKAVLEEVHLKVTVAVRKARPHHLYPAETVAHEYTHWSRSTPKALESLDKSTLQQRQW